MEKLHRVPFELIFWIMALVLLATATPVVSGEASHFTLCPLAAMGIEWCPGCGIGRAITHLLHGNIKESLELHWFGIPGLMIILYKITTLAIGMKKNNNKIKYKEKRYV